MSTPIDTGKNDGDADAEEDHDWTAVRELCATPLPGNAGDLLLDPDNKPVARYGAIFYFVAITDNSADVGQVPDVPDLPK